MSSLEEEEEEEQEEQEEQEDKEDKEAAEKRGKLFERGWGGGKRGGIRHAFPKKKKRKPPHAPSPQKKLDLSYMIQGKVPLTVSILGLS